MIVLMKTTLVISDILMTKIKALAAKQDMTLSRKIESLLRKGMGLEEEKPKKIPKIPTFSMGEALIDINDRDALFDLIDKEKKSCS